MKKPKIGVLLDFNKGSQKSYSARPHYALRSNYLEMIIKENAVTIPIPYDHSAIEDYIEMLDGLLMVGGFCDLNPKRYNENYIHQDTIINEFREEFEFDFSKKFLESKKPVFAICNGMQVINVIRGGSLIQDIQSEEKNYIIHEQSKIKGKEDPAKSYHQVLVEENSLLHKITKQREISTNSSHHQAIRDLGKNLEISARTADGIVEALEDKSHPFCIGVQWHPEYNVSKADQALFAAFVKSCS